MTDPADPMTTLIEALDLARRSERRLRDDAIDQRVRDGDRLVDSLAGRRTTNPL